MKWMQLVPLPFYKMYKIQKQQVSLYFFFKVQHIQKDTASLLDQPRFALETFLLFESIFYPFSFLLIQYVNDYNTKLLIEKKDTSCLRFISRVLFTY